MIVVSGGSASAHLVVHHWLGLELASSAALERHRAPGLLRANGPSLGDWPPPRDYRADKSHLRHLGPGTDPNTGATSGGSREVGAHRCSTYLAGRWSLVSLYLTMELH